MSRLILLLIFGLWLVSSTAMTPPAFGAGAGIGIFLGGYILLIVAVRIWAGRLAARLLGGDLFLAQKQFNRTITFARAMVPIWLGIGLFGYLGWGWWVNKLLPDIQVRGTGAVPLALPGLLIGTAPAMLAWMALWWAQFPADRALREQNLLDQLEQDVPVHAPPSLRQYMFANLRQQVLFMTLPILLILLVRDLAVVGIKLSGWSLGKLSDFENWIILPAAAIVFLIAPEVLRRVLKTSPLPDSSLRRRLEEICRRMGLRYRDILLWETQYSMGNAAVMGVVPRLRYILLSDLLLESLSDQQIEAVFAHELGHVTHHHMAWYVAFFGMMALATIGPGSYIANWTTEFLKAHGRWGAMLTEGAFSDFLGVIAGLAMLAIVLTLFGFLSRRCERQADVFAARMMESNWGMGRTPLAIVDAPSDETLTHVGEFGATIFGSALRKVAVINNIPVSARSWCHGSISRRMLYLDSLASDPARTSDFDRVMSRLYIMLILAIVACGALAMTAK